MVILTDIIIMLQTVRVKTGFVFPLTYLLHLQQSGYGIIQNIFKETTF